MRRPLTKTNEINLETMTLEVVMLLTLISPRRVPGFSEVVKSLERSVIPDVRSPNDKE